MLKPHAPGHLNGTHTVHYQGTAPCGSKIVRSPRTTEPLPPAPNLDTGLQEKEERFIGGNKQAEASSLRRG